MSILPACFLADLIWAGGHPRPINFPAINGSGASCGMLLGHHHREWLISDRRGYGQLLKLRCTLPAEEGGGGVRCPGMGHSDVRGYSPISAPASV